MLLHCFERTRVAYMLLNATPLFQRTIQSSIYATQCYSIVSKEQYRVAYMLHNATPLFQKNNTE